MAKRTVKVTGRPRQYEFNAASALKPGQHVDIQGGTVATVVAGGANNAPLQVVSEEGLFDYEGSKAVEGTYASGDQVPVIAPQAGDRVQVRLAGTAAGTLNIGPGSVVNKQSGGYVSEKAGTAVGVALESAQSTASDEHPLFEVQVR